MHNLTPFSGLIGGALIGLATSLLMLLTDASPASAAFSEGFWRATAAMQAGGSHLLRD